MGLFLPDVEAAVHNTNRPSENPQSAFSDGLYPKVKERVRRCGDTPYINGRGRLKTLV
ncbi:hypothetical protein [Kingella potus]|uniref:hypothetical protein n=1 Tax=Kingella potus TaxID=265175 RepID=UPI001FD068C9|nr:hypothetical protein [Kingella potus]UOP01681.1 hypothetical protein LVJ84_05960 [Kingella potus]